MSLKTELPYLATLPTHEITSFAGDIHLQNAVRLQAGARHITAFTNTFEEGVHKACADRPSEVALSL